MSRERIIRQLQDEDWEITNKEEKFLHSLQNSRHLEYLTVHTPEELARFRVYKIRGQNIGFAITEESEIISVHNNSEIRHLGRYVVEKAIALGGRKVFHYDGFLTGFYTKLGFIEKKDERLIWNDRYAPANWKFLPIDIDNPEQSVYAAEQISDPHSSEVITAARMRYALGKPDVITRFVKR